MSESRLDGSLSDCIERLQAVEDLACFAQGRLYRTGYVSIARGAGAQNLIGAEQGDLMGVLLTEEARSAHRMIDVEQFFTGVADFGFSKTGSETLAKWPRDRIVGDLTWIIRRFRPDVVILRYTGTPRDGHGNHQASAVYGRDAFEAAGNPRRYPEQLQHLSAWTPKRLVTVSFGAGQQRFDLGERNPLIGRSYAELGAMARAFFRSQGMGGGAYSRPGFVTFTAGKNFQNDLFEDIDTSWSRVPGGKRAGELLAQAVRKFDQQAPQKVLPLLLQARTAMLPIQEPWARFKLAKLEEAIFGAAGLVVEVRASKPLLTPGERLRCSVVATSEAPGVQLEGVDLVHGARTESLLNGGRVLGPTAPYHDSISFTISPDTRWDTPYWLERPRHGTEFVVGDPELTGIARAEPALRVRFRVRLEGNSLALVQPIGYRALDARGTEADRPVFIVPPVSARAGTIPLVFPTAEPKALSVKITSHRASQRGVVRVAVPSGWRAEPAALPFDGVRE